MSAGSGHQWPVTTGNVVSFVGSPILQTSSEAEAQPLTTESACIIFFSEGKLYNLLNIIKDWHSGDPIPLIVLLPPTRRS